MSTFSSRVKRHTPRVRAEISTLLDDVERSYAKRWPPGGRAISLLRDYTFCGGGSRGALVLLSAEAFGASPDAYTVRVAAALELLQSFLLIHDDIIDEDDTRRGAPAMHLRLADGNEEKGRARAICLGDISAMLAFVLVADGAASAQIASCIAEVGLGEIMDIDLSGDFSVSVDQVLDLYKIKTARYSVGLPLRMGALSAGRKADAALDRFAETTGVLFQLRDDELDLYGSDTGKPLGSDIAERKPSVPLLMYRDACGLAALEREVLSAPLSDALLALASTQGAVAALKEKLIQESQQSLAALTGLSSQGREDFAALVEFAASRNR